MSSSMWEVIASTPWWFYAMLFLAFKLALIATKPHAVPIKKLFVMPGVFVILSILIFAYTFKVTLENLSLWTGALIIGLLFGFLHFRLLKVKAIKHQAALYFPGSKIFFILIMLLFAAKYYFNTQLNNIDPILLLQPQFLEHLIPLYGFFTGMFIGKVVYALRCIKVGPYTADQAVIA